MPSDFIAEIRQKYGQAYPDAVPSAEYLQLHLAQTTELGALVDPVSFFEKYFAHEVSRLATLLRPSIAYALESQFAMGTLEQIEVNAFICRRGDEEVYAILVNRGFVLLLNHYVKLLTAVRMPEEVVFYQGISTKGLNRATYSQALRRLMDEYRQSGRVVGPELKLHLDGKARAWLEFELRQVFLFLLAHEIGHYVNGDLADKASLVNLDGWAGAKGLCCSKPEQEYQADVFAFEAVLRLAAQERPDLSVTPLFSQTVIRLFNVLRDISDRGSSTHPPASERMLALANEFLGEKARDLLKASFTDLSQFAAFEAIVGNVSVHELARRRPIGAGFIAPP